MISTTTKRPMAKIAVPAPLFILMAGAVVMFFVTGAVSLYERFFQEPSMPVTLYVTSIDEGADLTQYKIEQVGDQLIYEMPQHVLNNLQLTPDFIDCIDGLAISSIVTPANNGMFCVDGPAIHVALLSPR